MREAVEQTECAIANLDVDEAIIGSTNYGTKSAARESETPCLAMLADVLRWIEFNLHNQNVSTIICVWKPFADTPPFWTIRNDSSGLTSAPAPL